MIAFVSTLALVGALLVLSGLRHPHSRTRRVRPTVNPVAVVASALAGGSAALVVTAVPMFAVLAAVTASGLPALIVRRRQRAERLSRAQAWPSVLDDVTSAVRAGLNLPEALVQAGTRAPQDLRTAFAHFDADYRRSGDFNAALGAMRLRVDDRIFDQLAQSLTIARSVGGQDLTQALRSLGAFVRADVQLRGELLARQSWSVNAARMAVAAPWVVLVLLSTRPATIDAYRSTTGAVVLLAIAAGSIIAYGAMLRIARLDAVTQ